MQVFEMVFGIVLISCLASVLNHYMANKRAEREQHGQTAGDLQGRLSRIDELEQRVAVLERIVTDRKFDLKRQFEDLEAR